MDGIRPVSPPGATTPSYCNVKHDVGRIALGVSNDGTFATQLSVSASTRDCLTGEPLPSCEFPKNSRTSYCFGAALWIGAVLGRDTLVSTGADGWSVAANEFHPDEPPMGNMIYRSTINPAKPSEFIGAKSEQDYIARFADTCLGCDGVGLDRIDNRRHRPLHIEVTQRTYAWSYSYAQDFVLFDYSIKNIGDARLRRVYMGFYVDADIHDVALGGQGAQDDLNGFREWQPALYMRRQCPQSPPDSDQVNVAWTADNDGDLDATDNQPVPHVTAMRIIRTPSDSLEVSFNWWVSNGIAALDYGPQQRRKVRDFSTGGSGTPEGDRNKFHILSNGEFDFDQARCATINSLDSVWIPPPAENAPIWATGLDTRYVLSFGPFDIEPGQSLPITLAYVGGWNFHRSADNFDNLPLNPDSWYEGLNFDSLGTSATWADWVYDNPGVDTDSDGYFGESRPCVGSASSEDKVVWYKGDGVPDFRGASPPPAPCTYSTTDAAGVVHQGLRVESGMSRLLIRWNGVLCENTPDVFSKELDFEGYRVWMGLDERESSYSLFSSYDIEDYNRWDYVNDTVGFKLLVSPFTLEELRSLYAPDDTTWSPLDYPRAIPLKVRDELGRVTSTHYFEPQDFNQSNLGNYENAQTAIRKTYPNEPKPPDTLVMLTADSIRTLFPDGADSLYLTEEGFFRFYEYEYLIEGVLPTVPYWLDVTVFDYGSPQSGLASLETNPTLCPEVMYPLDRPDPDNPEASPVFLWPNPYRGDADYREKGFEARGETDWPEDRVHLIHFANLPERCTISIFSLDGDLIREIQHPDPTPTVGCPSTANESCWNLITRNMQLVVSGVYYWTVEDEAGNVQMGKLVVIM